MTFNHGVLGSSPSALTNNSFNDAGRFRCRPALERTDPVLRAINRAHSLAAVARGGALQRVIGNIDDQDLRIGLGFAAIVCARSKRRHASGNADAVPEEHGQPDAFPASSTVFTAMRASRRRRGDAIRDAHHAVHWLR